MDDFFNNASFAEIEYESIPSSTGKTPEGLFISPSAQAIKPVSQRTADPIRERFYAMRSLASENPFARNDAGLFYKQAKFMMDFTDEYIGDAQFSMYYPYYQHMGYEQLRTYFTWRTRVRNGNYPSTSSSYIFLYIYELLSGIGVNSSEEGLDKLMAIWSAYHEQDHDIKRYLPGWLKDYHVYYALSHSFTDFINKYKLQAYYSDLLLFESDAENSLDLWGSVSNYKVDKSKFYNSDDGTLLKDCFYAVLNGIRTFCVSRNTRIEDLFVYEVSKKLTWYPFRQALFYSWLRQPDRQVEIPGPEAYYCRNNRWTTDIAIHHSGRAVLVGYIIKKTEACLRQTIKYKYKITVDPDVVNRSFQKLKALRITLTDLDQVIENSVTAFYRDINRTVVTVDHGSLARIREEASGTQDMLIVPEVEPVSSSPSITPTLVSTLQESQMDLKSETDNWSILKNELSTIELEALKILLADVSETGIKAFANKNGIMIEVLADGINEKAADHIGDNLLDEDMIIYEDYAEKIAELVR